MKLVNPKRPNAKLSLGKLGVVQADAKGVVDVPEEKVDALIRGGYMKLADWDKIAADNKKKPKPDVSAIAAHALKAKEEMSKKPEAPAEAEAKAKKVVKQIEAEPAKAVESQSESVEEDVVEEELDQPEEKAAPEAAPKRGWSRRPARKE